VIVFAYRFVLIGRLTKILIARNSNHIPVATFTLAVYRPFHQTTMELMAVIRLYSLRRLEKTSRKCQQQIVKKGHMVAVEGRSDP
jgi:single-stranded DNA-binding protein